MELSCQECGAVLHINENLGGSTIPCPRCGGRIRVPSAQPSGGLKSTRSRRGGKDDTRRKSRRQAAPKPKKERKEKKEKPPKKPKEPTPARVRRHVPMTASLFGAQSAFLILAAACLAGAFYQNSWKPPAESFFSTRAYILVGAALIFLFGCLFARRRPLLFTILNVGAVGAACAWAMREQGGLDASRTLALAVAMLGVWFALGHHRTVARTES